LFASNNHENKKGFYLKLCVSSNNFYEKLCVSSKICEFL